MHLKVFTKCQMLCNAYDDMSGFSILNTRGVTSRYPETHDLLVPQAQVRPTHHSRIMGSRSPSKLGLQAPTPEFRTQSGA